MKHLVLISLSTGAFVSIRFPEWGIGYLIASFTFLYALHSCMVLVITIAGNTSNVLFSLP